MHLITTWKVWKNQKLSRRQRAKQKLILADHRVAGQQKVLQYDGSPIKHKGTKTIRGDKMGRVEGRRNKAEKAKKRSIQMRMRKEVRWVTGKQRRMSIEEISGWQDKRCGVEVERRKSREPEIRRVANQQVKRLAEPEIRREKAQTSRRAREQKAGKQVDCFSQSVG